MQLQPKDLGDTWHIAVVRYRALGTARINTPPHIGRLGRLWASGLNLPEEVAAATLPMMADHASPLAHFAASLIVIASLVSLLIWGWGMLLFVLPIAALLLFLVMVVLPRRTFHNFHTRPVNWEELEAVKGPAIRSRNEENELDDETERGFRPIRNVIKLFQTMRGTRPGKRNDELERTFLTFAQEVVSARGFSPSTETELRGVLRAMGNTIGSLPFEDAQEADDIADVLTDAEMLVARAEREKDRIVAESLLRQAEAHVSRATAIENNRKLARRIRVLREEMLGQVKMVRSLLPSLKEGAGVSTDQNRFNTLSQNVQSIATEAVSVSAARDELARTLWNVGNIQTEPEQVLRVQAGA
ncbi:MAG: hypothetical protein OHK0029_03400 [Armatimonadaceae bacterium]